jgi:hypothetical protein
MGRLYLVGQGGDLAERRKALPPRSYVEIWQDLFLPGAFWISEETKALLEGGREPLTALWSLASEHVPIYYGPRLRDLESLPSEDSVRLRVLSAHGIACAWVTYDREGKRWRYDPSGPDDPVFYLRRPGSHEAHLWHLFHTRAEVATFAAEALGDDPDAEEWARRIEAEDYEDLLRRLGQREKIG